MASASLKAAFLGAAGFPAATNYPPPPTVVAPTVSPMTINSATMQAAQQVPGTPGYRPPQPATALSNATGSDKLGG